MSIFLGQLSVRLHYTLGEERSIPTCKWKAPCVCLIASRSVTCEQSGHYFVLGTGKTHGPCQSKETEKKELTQHFLEFKAQAWNGKSKHIHVRQTTPICHQADGRFTESTDEPSFLCTSSLVFALNIISPRTFMFRHIDLIFQQQHAFNSLGVNGSYSNQDERNLS